ncbi:MAG TPA: hypothetical protein VIU46_03255 [Gallionellaceae bacterium]
MSRVFLCLGCLMAMLPGALLAEEATVWKQAIGFPEFYGYRDSEGFSAYKLGAGFYPRYEHGDRYTGVEYQKNHYSQGNWSSWGNEARLVTREINPRTALGYNLSLGYNQENNFGLLTTNSQYGFGVTDDTRLELLLMRDRVETQNAIINNVYYTLPALSVEHKLLERLTLVAMGGDMFFSDTNSRLLLRLKLLYDLVPEQGITAQLRYRRFHDSNTNVAFNYFNPASYDEAMLALGMRRRVSGWVLDGAAGLGRQSVNGQPTTTQLLEAGATSPLAERIYFRARLGYGKSANFQGPNSSFRYLMGELIFSP